MSVPRAVSVKGREGISAPLVIHFQDIPVSYVVPSNPGWSTVRGDLLLSPQFLLPSDFPIPLSKMAEVDQMVDSNSQMTQVWDQGSRNMVGLSWGGESNKPDSTYWTHKYISTVSFMGIICLLKLASSTMVNLSDLVAIDCFYEIISSSWVFCFSNAKPLKLI